ncbi:heparinase II/III family protein [Campylobacter lari]|nr:heparinase II/III family protein [Campylobacter lari]
MDRIILDKIKLQICNQDNLELGKKYFEKGELVLKPFKGFKIGNWQEWEIDPFKNRTWQWKLHWFSFLPFLLSYHYHLKKDKMLDEIKNIINSWFDSYIDTDKETVDFEFIWHDHCMALRAEQLVELYLYLKHYGESKWLGENENFLTRLLNAIVKHAFLLSKDEYFTKYTNHGLEQARVLLILGLFLKKDEYKVLAISRIKDEMLFAFTDEGVHVENSPSYHIFVLKVFIAIIKTYPEYIIKDLAVIFDIISKKALKFITHILRPDGNVPIIGDSEQDKTSDAYKAFYENTQEYSNLLYALSLGNGGMKPIETNVVYEKSGYVIFRDKWNDKDKFNQSIQLVCKVGCLSRYHHQQDEGHVNLYAFGEDWLIDSGLYNHNNTDPIRKYMRSRMAHNIPLISNANYDIDFDHRSNAWKILDYSTDKIKPWCKIELKVLKNIIHHRTISMNFLDSSFDIEDEIIMEDGLERDVTMQWHIPLDKHIIISGTNLVTIKGKNQYMRLNIKHAMPNEIFTRKGIKNERVFSVISLKPNVYHDSYVLRYVFKNKKYLKITHCFDFKLSNTIKEL